MHLLADHNVDQRILNGVLRELPDTDILFARDVGLDRTKDPGILEWAAQAGRVLLTHDVDTMPRFAYDRIRNGQPMPGVIVIPDQLPIGLAFEYIVLLYQCILEG